MQLIWLKCFQKHARSEMYFQTLDPELGNSATFRAKIAPNNDVIHVCVSVATFKLTDWPCEN